MTEKEKTTCQNKKRQKVSQTGLQCYQSLNLDFIYQRSIFGIWFVCVMVEIFQIYQVFPREHGNKFDI